MIHISIGRGCILITLLLTLTCVSVPQTDPNADPNWDWRAGDNPGFVYPGSEYRIYIGSPVSAVFIKAPWSQFNAWDGLDDNRREDGWVLVARDFGTPTRAISTTSTPGVGYMALYNKYSSVLRVFLLVKAQTNFSNGAIIMQFGSSTKTATLTHLKSRAYATDKLSQVQNNAASALTNTVADGIWVWGDFPMAFDNTIVPSSSADCPRLTFQVIGTTETDLQMSGIATGVGGTKKNVREFMSGGLDGVVSTSDALPTTTGSTTAFGDLRTKVFGTSSEWAKWKTSLDDLYKNLGTHTGTDPLSVISNQLASAVNSLKNNWIVQNLPGIGAVVGLVDALFGGGKDPTKIGPTFYAYNLNLTGTATTNYYLAAGATIPVPAAKSNPEVPSLGTSVPILYNDPVGIINLGTTPILKYKLYSQGYPWSPTDPHRQYWDFQVKDNLDIRINTNSGLVLDSIRAWIVMDPSPNVYLASPFTDKDLKLLATWVQGQNNPRSEMELESTIDQKYVFRSKPVDGLAFRYQTIQGPDGKFISPGLIQMGFSPDMTIKLKAVFHRLDDPSTIPVVVVLTYEPDFEDGGTGNWPAPPEPVLANVGTNWNMISVPNQSYNYQTLTFDFSKAFIYPTSISNAFYYNGGYVSEDPLHNGLGYWIKFPSNQTITYLGPPLNLDTVDVVPGWNLIGSITSALPSDKVKSLVGDVETPGNLISPYYRYTPGTGYQTTTVIQPGFGHWVKVSANGRLVLDETSIGSTPPPITQEQPPPVPGTPSVPVLQAPVNGSTNVSTSPTMYWYVSSGASSYRLQVSTNSSFSNLIFNQGGITSTSKQIGSLSYSQTYYWRVNASNSFGASNWSDIRWFSTTSAPPPDPCQQTSSILALDQLTVINANGESQTLFLNNAGRELGLGYSDLSTPPKPPLGAFHARFISGQFIQDIPVSQQRNRIPIEISNPQLPITLSWDLKGSNKTKYWLPKVKNQNMRTELTGTGEIVLTDLDNGLLIIEAQASQPCDPYGTRFNQDVVEEVLDGPKEFELFQNTPNPFNPTTRIEYALPQGSWVSLKIFNTLGQEVTTLVDIYQDIGIHSVQLDAANFPSGVYFYQLRAGSFSEMRKMIVMK